MGKARVLRVHKTADGVDLRIYAAVTHSSATLVDAYQSILSVPGVVLFAVLEVSNSFFVGFWNSCSGHGVDGVSSLWTSLIPAANRIGSQSSGNDFAAFLSTFIASMTCPSSGVAGAK